MHLLLLCLFQEAWSSVCGSFPLVKREIWEFGTEGGWFVPTVTRTIVICDEGFTNKTELNCLRMQKVPLLSCAGFSLELLL